MGGVCGLFTADLDGGLEFKEGGLLQEYLSGFNTEKL